MKTVYLDTSAFLKPFLTSEPGVESIEKILDLARNNKVGIVISEWVVNESIATVERKVKDKRIKGKDAFNLVTGIADLLEDVLQNTSVKSYATSNKVVLGSRVSIQRYHINAADALHVVVAEAADCDYSVTADKAMVAALKKSKSRVKPVYINTIKPRSKFFKDIQ